MSKNDLHLSHYKYLPATSAVKTFMQLAGQTVNNSPTQPSDEDVYLRNRLILEEVTEFVQATLGQTPEAKNVLSLLGQAYAAIKELQDNKVEIKGLDMLEALDAVTDIEVINLGTAVTFGFDVDAAFDIVHQSNMSKRFDDGLLHKNEFGKVIKGPNYKAPDLSVLL